MGNPYVEHFESQRGGAMPFFAGVPYQRGGFFLGRAMKALVTSLQPIWSMIKPKLISGAVSVGKDVLEGKSFKESAKSNLKKVGREVADDVLNRLAQSGSGLRRKRKRRATLKVMGTRKTKRRKKSTKKKLTKAIKGAKKITKKKPKRRKSKGRRLKVKDQALLRLANLHLN